MKKNILSFLILVSGILISGGIISFAHAQTDNQAVPGISFPVVELGNCADKTSCKAYCDKSENIDACLSFAEQRKLMSTEELSNAKKFKDNGMVGPGSCKGKDACEQYCSDSNHLEECTAFAEKKGMMSDQQLQDSKKVITAIKSGLKPPACTGAKCKAYCSNPSHMEECMTFSIAAGIVPDNQKEQMQKTLEALKQGVKPPACQPNPPSDQLGQSEQTNQSSSGLPMCNQYCGTHQEECMTFSLATGMVPDDQKEQVQKTIKVLKQGIKPPSCRPNPPDQSSEQSSQSKQSDQSVQGLQSCDQYCADSSHVEECVKFSVAIGNMTEEQGKNSIKNGNKGPGGCIGKDACDTFCSNPDNQDACFNFAKDNGMIPQEDLQKMQEGQQKMKDSFSSIPPEVLDCLTSTVGADVVEKMKTGSVVGRKYGDSINQCFQKSGIQERKPDQNQDGQDQSGENQQMNQGQSNQQIQPWADMCQPDENGNPTVLACVDGDGKFVASAKVGSDGKPVCPESSTAKCGNYQQNNQQGKQGQQNQQGQNQQGQPNQQINKNNQGKSGDKFQPGPGTKNPSGQQMPQQAGPGGCKGPEECKAYCESNQEECKNIKPQQEQQGGPNQGQGFNPGSGVNGNGPGLNQDGSKQSGQMLPKQQPSQPNNLEQGNTDSGVAGPCGTGPGTCLGIGPDDIKPQNGSNGPGGPNQGQGFNPGSGVNGNGPGFNQGGQPNQPNQMQPQLPPQQQNLPPPSSPSSFLQGMQNLLANVLNAFS
ncbi:MAG: hypothetical protein WAV23_00775 [Minisyncoccia bacterium]